MLYNAHQTATLSKLNGACCSLRMLMLGAWKWPVKHWRRAEIPGKFRIVRGLLGTDSLDPTLKSASPSPPQGSIWHRLAFSRKWLPVLVFTNAAAQRISTSTINSSGKNQPSSCKDCDGISCALGDKQSREKGKNTEKITWTSWLGREFPKVL